MLIVADIHERRSGVPGPGISTVSARALLARFGSIAAVLAAKPYEWEGVNGIGPWKAQSLAEALRYPYPH